MYGFLLTTLITALSLLVTDILFPKVDIANFPAALVAAIVIGLVNACIRPVLSILSLPINLLTLGSFSLVINGICFWLASVLTPGFTASGILTLLLAPIILSLGTILLNRYFAEREPLSLPNFNFNDKSLESSEK
ncbi:MAG: phage holin family protein [Acaryochloridaceae cyanobacterium RU_4_10]|jgi:putative membrane protein|nr:phage holin family protein [Acaryochloridaceae cyanobacterium RU_4_10]